MFAAAKEHVRPVAVVCDIGPGIQPMSMFKAEQHICIEPYWEYADWLAARHYPVIRSDALTGLSNLEPVDSVFLLDVIEHMDKETGRQVLQKAVEKAREQVVVFTPLGFYEQSYQDGDKDAWGMGGTEWQTHRSGWMPEDFKGWHVMVDREFHGGKGAICAIHG